MPGAGWPRREVTVRLVATAQQALEALPVTRMCQVLGLSCSTYYRWPAEGPALDHDLELRAQIQEFAVEMPAYSYRRITYELQRRHVIVNHLPRSQLRRFTWLQATDAPR
jgi:hypothetical protein